MTPADEFYLNKPRHPDDEFQGHAGLRHEEFTWDEVLNNFWWFLCGIGFIAALIAACFLGGLV